MAHTRGRSPDWPRSFHFGIFFPIRTVRRQEHGRAPWATAPRYRDSGAPLRTARRRVSGGPLALAKVSQKPLGGSFDEVEDLLEAVRATVVGVGNLGHGRVRCELQE